MQKLKCLQKCGCRIEKDGSTQSFHTRDYIHELCSSKYKGIEKQLPKFTQRLFEMLRDYLAHFCHGNNKWRIHLNNNRTYITAFAPIPWQWQVAKQSFFHCHWNETMVIYTAGSSTFVYDCCKIIEITVVTNLCSTCNVNVCSYQFIKLSSLSWCLFSHPVFFHTVMVSPLFSVDIDNCFNLHKNEYRMLLKHSWNEWQWRLLCTDIIITVCKQSCGKVMFLHLSVSHSVHSRTETPPVR